MIKTLYDLEMNANGSVAIYYKYVDDDYVVNYQNITSEKVREHVLEQLNYFFNKYYIEQSSDGFELAHHFLLKDKNSGKYLPLPFLNKNQYSLMLSKLVK